MDWRPFGAVFVIVLLTILVGVGSAVPNAQLTVSGVTVDPGEPTATEPVTVTPTVQSSAGSDEPVEIESVTATVGGEEIDEKTNVGTLSPGDSLSVPFTTTFDEPGTYTITFTFVGVDDQGEEVTVTREETVLVSPVPAVRLTVDDVAIEPETPTAGAPVTVPISVDSSGGSTQPVDVDSVALLDGDRTLATAEGVGSLAVGDGLTVPLTTTFAQAGEKQLTARLNGTNANDEPVTVTQPVSVVIEPGAPAIEVGNRSAVQGISTDISIFVSNPTEATLRNIVTTVDGDGLNAIIDRRVVPSLDPGETTELSFTVQPETAGEALLETNISYTTAAATTATVRERTPMSVEPLEEAVSVRVQTVSSQPEQQDPDLGVGVEGILDTGGGEETAERQGDVEVTISNLGNAPVTDVVLEPRTANRSLGPRPVTSSLAPGTSESVVVSLERTPAAEIIFETTYTAGTEQSESAATFDPVGNRGSVSVTSVDLEDTGDQLEITGDIGNPGGDSVSGVVVRVESGTGVAPVYPNRDFFIGEIDSNSFAPFELTASVGENATHIPLEVTYLVDGDQRTRQVELPVEEPPGDDSGNGPPLVLTAGILGMLGILLVTIVLFARRE